MNLLNLSGQRLVFDGARAGPGTPLLPSVVTAGGNFQVQAEYKDRVIGFHRIDPFIPLEDGSERMPSVFLKWCIAPASDGPRAARRPIALADRPPSPAWPPSPSPQRRREPAFARHKASWQ